MLYLAGLLLAPGLETNTDIRYRWAFILKEHTGNQEWSAARRPWQVRDRVSGAAEWRTQSCAEDAAATGQL